MMKTFTKVMLMMVAVMMVATGCQTIDDDIDVFLKSSGALTIINNWKSGNAAYECAAAGGDCSYAFKIDEWNEKVGMDGDYETLEGNSIVILNSDGKTFDWTSEYPVCKVIVKAGRGAIIYNFPEGGVYEDSGLVGFQGKGISHVTFCYAEPPELVITVKSYYSSSDGNKYCVSKGTQAFVGTEWCATYPLGINDYPSTASFDMFAPGSNAVIGEVTIENGDVTVTLNEGFTLIYTWLYIGTLESLQTTNLKADGCPWYTNSAVWMRNNTPDTDVNGLSFMFYNL